MLASELVKKLEQKIKDVGDLEVAVIIPQIGVMSDIEVYSAEHDYWDEGLTWPNNSTIAQNKILIDERG